MKEVILKLYFKFGIKSERTKKITKHIGQSFLYKIGSIVANFLLVPIAIGYLDQVNYGIWLTLTSFISWFSFFDIGLGNGLRNKFAEARVRRDEVSARSYVSTAYFTIAGISFLIFLIFLAISYFVNWSKIFNTSPALEGQLSILILIVFAFFCIQLLAKLIVNIYQAEQDHSIQNRIQFITQMVTLLLVWLLTKTEGNSLLIFGTIFSLIPVIVLVGLNFLSFNLKFKNYKPALRYWSKDHLKDITGLGVKFFVVQMAAMVIFSTDNFLISHFFSPKEVVPYNIVFKYFSILTIAYTIIVTPFWSSFTESYANRDFEWIKESIRNIQKIWFCVPFILFIMILVSHQFYFLWVGDQVVISTSLNVSIAVYVWIYTFGMVYNYFLNGTGKIKLHLIVSVIIMFLNIPISWLLAIYFDWGIPGVVLGSSLCILMNSVYMPYQCYLLINEKAYGIWQR